MARNKTKDSDAVSFRIRKDISETAIVEMALEEYLGKVASTKKNKK